MLDNNKYKEGSVIIETLSQLPPQSVVFEL